MDRLPVFKALGDNTRYAIYLELARSAAPLSTIEIAETLGLHANTVRPHLERMRDVGLLDVEIEARGSVGRPQHRYSLAAEAPSLGLEPAAFPLLSRLLADAAIVRNRLKVEAAIENARRIVALRDSDGGFARWLNANHPLDKAQWVKLFKRTFRFTGGEIVGEFLMSIGYLPGAHAPHCPVYRRIARLRPAWMRTTGTGPGRRKRSAARESP